MEPINYSLLEDSHGTLKQRWPDVKPVLGFILGSGWGAVSSAFETKESIKYSELPGMGHTGVAGHSGVLSWASHCGRDLLFFQGRRHAYEGAGWTPIALPVYLLKSLGAEAIVITNAAGGVRSDLSPGDLMLINDHVNLMGINPLTGAHHPFWGERFVDLTQAYDPELSAQLRAAARDVGENLKEGVYGAALGPCYETPAEVRMLQRLGIDAVGMSTVPCAILARACGLRVLGISCITNHAAGITSQPLTHTEVMEASQAAMARIRNLITRFADRAGIPA